MASETTSSISLFIFKLNRGNMLRARALNRRKISEEGIIELMTVTRINSYC